MTPDPTTFAIAIQRARCVAPRNPARAVRIIVKASGGLITVNEAARCFYAIARAYRTLRGPQ